jgi:hypothetical protein
MKMKKYSLELTVFLSDAIVMMLEVKSYRTTVPFVGASTVNGILSTEIKLTN